MDYQARLHALQARAKAQGMTEAEFAALVRAVNDRAMVSSTWGFLPERLDEIEAALQDHATADRYGKDSQAERNRLARDAEYRGSHRFMK